MASTFAGASGSGPRTLRPGVTPRLSTHLALNPHQTPSRGRPREAEGRPWTSGDPSPDATRRDPGKVRDRVPPHRGEVRQATAGPGDPDRAGVSATSQRGIIVDRPLGRRFGSRRAGTRPPPPVVRSATQHPHRPHDRDRRRASRDDQPERHPRGPAVEARPTSRPAGMPSPRSGHRATRGSGGRRGDGLEITKGGGSFRDGDQASTVLTTFASSLPASVRA